MKPLNLDNSPCTPTSSNCVIWQGPNIPCIKLCTGDTVSDVIHKLATELCLIMDTLNVSNYDLACLNLPCAPEDFQTLIQILINRICELENIPVPAPDGGGDLKGSCPTNCFIAVPTCLGGGVEPLTDYVVTLGNKICDLITEISVIQTSIANIDITLIDLQTQINNIPVYTLPDVTPDCPIGVYVGPTQLDTLFEAFINDVWCPISTVFGSSVDITTAIASQCVSGGDTALQFQYSLPAPLNEIQNQYTYNSTPATIADAISNLWVALCDVRNAGHKETVVQAGANITVTSVTAVPLGSNDLVTTYTVSADIVDTGWVNLEGFDYYGVGVAKPQCRKIGKVVYFRGVVYVPLSNDGGTTVIPLTSGTTYVDQYFKAPWTGTSMTYGSGVQLDNDGAVIFNLNNSVIPASVHPGNFDSSYSNQVIASRQLEISPTKTTALSSYNSVSITNTGKLILVVLKDLEQSTGYTGLNPSSPLRFITSYIRSTDYIPNYIGANAYIHNADTAAPAITQLAVDDIATNWPLTLDAAEETDIGGFAFRLDGLTAFIA